MDFAWIDDGRPPRLNDGQDVGLVPVWREPMLAVLGGECVAVQCDRGALVAGAFMAAGATIVVRTRTGLRALLHRRPCLDVRWLPNEKSVGDDGPLHAWRPVEASYFAPRALFPTGLYVIHPVSGPWQPYRLDRTDAPRTREIVDTTVSACSPAQARSTVSLPKLPFVGRYGERRRWGESSLTNRPDIAGTPSVAIE